MGKKRVQEAAVYQFAQASEDFAASSEGPQQRKHFHLKDLKTIVPLTENQKTAFELLNTEAKTVAALLGVCGSGKSFVAIQQALKLLLTAGNGFDKVIIIRSAVATRDIGFLPGDMAEKMAVFEAPYVGIFDELFPWKNSYENMKKAGKVEFKPTSFLRGVTFANAIVIVDECQDLTFHELDTIISRVGENSRIFFSGDTKQNDLLYKKNDQSGLVEFLSVLDGLDEFGKVEFGPDDIVRSGLVKSYIKRKWELGK